MVQLMKDIKEESSPKSRINEAKKEEPHDEAKKGELLNIVNSI